MAFINGALHYQRAADTLADIRRDAPGDRYGLDPIYLLYFHALELAFKGYLRAQGRSTAELLEKFGHRLTTLYDETGLGVGIAADVVRNRQSVLSLLEGGNKWQGLRYFSLESRALPDLQWTSEVVAELVDLCRAEVVKRDPEAEKPGRAVKVDWTIGKPQPK